MLSRWRGLGDVKLVGRIDRIDRLPDGTPLVLDYKTEASAKTANRVREPFEDTQMSFYAALLPNDTLQGAYVNVGERDGTRTYAQPELLEARDALVEGIPIAICRARFGHRDGKVIAQRVRVIRLAVVVLRSSLLRSRAPGTRRRGWEWS